MGVIDVDPAVLRQAAAASAHAAEQTWVHLEAEIVGNVPKLMETLKPDGPYGYMTMPQVAPNGRIALPIVGDWSGINDAYTLVRGGSDIHSTVAAVEVRGAWYTFANTVSVAQVKGADSTLMAETVVILPSSTGTGITGELVWVRMPTEKLGTASAPDDLPTDERGLRLHLVALHDRYIDALRAADPDAIVVTYNDDVQGATRDYVDCSGRLVGLDGKDAHRAYYRALFDLYEVESVTYLDRVAADWYVFAELRFEMRRRSDGAQVAFHTAEFFVPGRDGRFIVRIGHGTDPA